MDIPTKVIERLSSYRRHLRCWQAEGKHRIYSHELAALQGVTPAQVRRDLMTIGYTGSPAKGYDVDGLIEHVSQLLDPKTAGEAVLVGVGHLGRAILDYFTGRHPGHRIVAAFDTAPDKVGRVMHGCHCYNVSEMPDLLRRQPVAVGIIAVPAEAAQEVADQLIKLGVSGLLNFAPTRLRVPTDVYVEDVDIALSLEKVAFFAHERRSRREAQ